MSNISVVATITPAAGCESEVLAALQAAVKVTLGEPGCESYVLHRTKESFVVLESWEDGAALKAHAEGEGNAALTAALEGRLSTPIDVKVMRPV